ncbi:uncharacterized protein LOC118464639 isoform X4 [Anopheles albimanus]|uniref:uncharacterized protein LOC118464639 isoform X4 n=1 Tax=Anopheles albimanus TaxID=7167 RepID=UPI001640F496|nr:uncharacterized protein LOC118464639 isoform X4 [Anopheles albimanus]
MLAMLRSQRPVQAPTSGPEDGGTNNVTGLISKFEVRNYPINRGSVGSLTDAVPGAKVPGKPIERYEAYHQRYNSSGYGTPREIRTPDHGSRYPVSRYGSNLLDSQAYFSDSAESVPQKIVTAGMAATRSARTGAPQHFYHNGSLSSLNESDYYEDMYEDTRPHVRRGSGRPTISHGDAAGFLETEEDEATPMTQERVATSLSRFGAILQMLCRIPFPRMSVTGMGLCSLVAIFFFPRAIGSNILFPGFRLLFGTLYPAYASYKAVRTKNVKEYVKWMMYWIVFAFFTCIETFTDILLSWFPFYYEIKVIIVLWLLSPATRGSSTLYRKFVHPMLTRREQEIDDYINQAKEKGYTAVLQLGSKGVNYATNVIMQTAIKAFGTKAHTPVHGMMRLSQSDNSLLIAATAAASMAGHAGPSRSAIHAAREQRDEHDSRGGGIIASPPPYDSTVATLSRVRRSQSVDSALNRSTAAAEGRSTRSSTSRSVTRDGAATTINQHAIIYELDSEEEEAERFLAAETEYLLQDAASDQRNVQGVPQRSRRAAAGRAAVTIAAAVNADDSDDGGSTQSAASVAGTSKVTKRKPTAQIGTERAKKKSNIRSTSTEPAATTTAALTKSTTAATTTTTTTGTAARGRKKVRKDSGSATDGMEVE